MVLLSTLLVVASLVIGDETAQSDGQPLSPEESFELLDRNVERVDSYDIRLSATIRQLSKFERPNSTGRVNLHDPDRTPQGRASIVDLPPGEENVFLKEFRQVYLFRGVGVQPLRRVDEIVVDGGELIRARGFDGDAFRSFVPKENSGLIGGPPPEDFRYAQSGCDYYELLGSHFAKGRISDPFRERETRVTTDGDLLLLHAPIDRQSGGVPMAGYRAWLDPAHGMSLARFQRYEVIPREQNGRRIGGDDQEHVVYECIVDAFHELGSGIWVPIRATTNRYRLEWISPESGEIIRHHMYEIVALVDTEDSSWNKAIDESEFAFDFPPGTQVYNELIEAHIVVGDEQAGRHLDDLLAEADRVIPATDAAAQRYPISGQVRTHGTGKAPASRVVLILVLNVVAFSVIAAFWYYRRGAHRGN